MLFNSFAFLALLVPTLALYWATRWLPLRLACLFVTSIVFYSAYHWPSVFLLLGSIAVNYTLGRWQGDTQRRSILWLAIVSNAAVLFYFKYAAFAAGEALRLGAWLGLPVAGLAPPKAFLPLGISFFTFQVIAYHADVYRREIAPERSLLVFGVFKSFFAQLIAGPIVRAHDFLPQLRRPAPWSDDGFRHGAFLFIAGVGLKMGVADVLGQFAGQAFSAGLDQATNDAWLGLFAFAFQLFADFWAYSTMAVGLGQLFGLELPRNFDAPYTSQSLQEFWRRWHMTLSAWFRDYVYIPLGGNRAHRRRNTILTMTIAAVWHGAGWTFVLWGFLHGTWLAVEPRWFRGPPSRTLLARSLRTAAVFLGACLLWVLFRAPDLPPALTYYQRLLLPPYSWNPRVPEVLPVWLIGFAALHPALNRALHADRFASLGLVRQVALSSFFLLLALAYGGARYDFIYFAF